MLTVDANQLLYKFVDNNHNFLLEKLELKALNFPLLRDLELLLNLHLNQLDLKLKSEHKTLLFQINTPSLIKLK